MPKSIQAKLLRVIQDGVVASRGQRDDRRRGQRALHRRDQRRSRSRRQGGEMREDLYYRLRVVPINVPGALRERPEDIPLLATIPVHLLVRHRRQGRAVPPPDRTRRCAPCVATTGAATSAELQNVIEHVAVVVEPGAEFRPEDLHLTATSPRRRRARIRVR